MLNKLKLDMKLLKELDFGLLITSVIIVLYGIANIFLVTKNIPNATFTKKQLIVLAVSLVVLYLILLVDYTIVKGFVGLFYWSTILMLLYTKFFGRVINGARGWIFIGSFSIQPAELAKIAIIFMFAKKLEDMDGKINDFKNFLILCLYAAIPMILILKQPDMGMTMVCFFTVLGVMFIAGLDKKVIIGGLMTVVTSIVVLWNSSLMKPYWKKRLTTFLDPDAYELGDGLQLKNSMIAIGSGGVFGGKIMSSGVSYASVFVPEIQTDMIFSGIAENWGIIGAMLLLFLYGVVVYKMVNIAKNSKDIFGSIVAGGFVATLLFSILQNIGMTIGIMPITGITLPFVSYGGSSLLTNFMVLGLILNIGMRKKKINF